jgi:hypothetical protein
MLLLMSPLWSLSFLFLLFCSCCFVLVDVLVNTILLFLFLFYRSIVIVSKIVSDLAAVLVPIAVFDMLDIDTDLRFGCWFWLLLSFYWCCFIVPVHVIDFIFVLLCKT